MTRICYLALALFVVAACSSAVETPTTPVSATTTTVPPPTATNVYEFLAMVSHPNGAQLRVSRVEVFPTWMTVSGTLTNGSLYELRIGNGVTELRTEEGWTAPLFDQLPAHRIPPAGEMPFTLRFGSLPEGDSVIFVFNEGGGADPLSPTTNSPTFELGPIVLDPDATRPPLPDPVAISRTLTRAGIELRIEGANFTENRIGLWVHISNPLDEEVRIAPSIAPTAIIDDLGNRYPLLLPGGQGYISVPAQTALSGTLAFGGRIDPLAGTLTLQVNSGSNRRIYPELEALDIPLTGEVDLTPLPDAVGQAATIDHPAFVRVELLGVSFSEQGMEIPVVMTNDRADVVALAGMPTFAYDDLFNRYSLVPFPDNPHLIIEGKTTIEATLAFSPRVADGASNLTVLFNSGESTEDPETPLPSFSFGPFDLERTQEAAEPPEAKLFVVGVRSRLAPAELAASQVDQITQTLGEFDATEVVGGFQLTLPESILFDFGSSDLRPDAFQALSLIAEILRYFSDAEVLVVGHTDSIGSPATNLPLSQRRAESVVDALVSEHGISAERFSAEGRGATEPVAPNTNPDGSDNPEGRQLNRRVEIIVFTDQPVELP